MLSGARMHEGQLPRVQALRVHSELWLFVSIDRVSENGVASPRQMHADLVRPPRFEPALQECIARKALQHAPVRHGLAAVLFRHAHFLPIRRIAPDRRVDGAAVLADVSADDAGIGARKRVILELRGKRPVCKVVFRRDQQPRRVLVDAVDNAGAKLAADAGETVPAVMHQRVDERPAPMARRRMDDQPLRLVDNDHVRVLIHHVQRNVLRLQRDLLHLRQLEFQRVALRQTVALARGASVEPYRAVLDQLLRRAA